VLGLRVEVEQAGNLHDVSVLTQVPVGVGGDLPRPLRDLSDGIADGVSVGVADRELRRCSDSAAISAWE